MMKLVKEHINEKFTEDSDPIRDLKIGGIDINAEWKALQDDMDVSSDVKIKWKELWRKRLEKLFIGKKVTGNFSIGDATTYGITNYQITTKSKVIRIELEHFNNFSLVCIKKRSWKTPPDLVWHTYDEIWYVVELDENEGRTIFVK